MTVLAAFVVAVGLVAGAGVLVGVDRLLRLRRRHKVIVTCKDGTSWSGVLAGVDRRVMVLRNTVSHGSAQGDLPVDGEVLLHRSDVAFVQRP